MVLVSFTEPPNGGPMAHQTIDDYSIWEWICLGIAICYTLQGLIQMVLDTVLTLWLIPCNLDQNRNRFLRFFQSVFLGLCTVFIRLSLLLLFFYTSLYLVGTEGTVDLFEKFGFLKEEVIYFSMGLTLFLMLPFIGEQCIMVKLAFSYLSSAVKNICCGNKEDNDSISDKDVEKRCGEAPHYIVTVPVYNENPDCLWLGVNSVFQQKYDSDKIHLLVAFDGQDRSELWYDLMERLGHTRSSLESQPEIDTRVVKSFIELKPDDEVVVHDSARAGLVEVTVCRFVWGGKRNAQKNAFDYTKANIINKPDVVGKMFLPDSTFILYTDSDSILDSNCLEKFASRMEGEKLDGCTGYITCLTANIDSNFFPCLQDADYLQSQIMFRQFETKLGGLTCLPGALTCYRYNSFDQVQAAYFDIDNILKSQFEMNNPNTEYEMTGSEFHRFHLGEDRYLTHLLMTKPGDKGKLSFEKDARCKTEAPDDFYTLLRQRRRWFLGTFTNAVANIMSPTFWKRFPVLMALVTLKYLMSCFASFLISGLCFVLGGFVPLGVAFFLIAPYIFLYFTFIVISVANDRKKIILAWPLYCVLLPTFSLFVNVYSLYTWNDFTWGGPRADLDQTASPTPTKKNNDFDLENVGLEITIEV